MIYSIYRITNIVNNKVYIGLSSDVEKRWKRHINGESKCKALCNAFTKHGVYNFTFDVIFQTKDLDYAKQMEIDFINTFKSFGIDGYNLTKGGDGLFGFKHSLETRIEMSAFRTGKIGTKRTPETCRRISEAKKKNKISPENRKRMVIGQKKLYEDKTKHPRYNKFHSDETKIKISNNKLNSAITFSKEYIIIYPNGSEILIKNLSKFSRENNLQLSCLYKVMHGVSKHHKGFKIRPKKDQNF